MTLETESKNKEHPEAMSGREILELGHQTVKDLISLIQQDGDEPTPNLIIPESQCKPERKMVTWSSNVSSEIRLIIENPEGEQNITNIYIQLHPIDNKRTNLLQGIEEGLIDEHIATDKTKPKHRKKNVKKLRDHTATGTDLIQLQLMLTKDPSVPGNLIPIGCNLFLTTGSDTAISFDAIKHYQDVIEDPGQYSRIVFTRALRKIKKIIEMERSIVIERALSIALSNKQQIGRLIAETRTIMNGTLAKKPPLS